jgi:hypothetical protein
MPAKTKTSKKSAFLSKINPNTPIKKFFLFVIIFALLGGGYFAYKSFAATNEPRTVVYADDGIGWHTGRIVKETKGAKRGTKVIEMSAGQVAGAAALGIPERPYRVCVLFKLWSGGVIQATINPGVYDPTHTMTERINIPKGNNEYQRRCTVRTATSAYIHWDVKLLAGSDLRVRAISIEP